VSGFYLHLEDMSSPRSETEWTDLFTGPLRTHHPAERGVRAELSSESAKPYLPAGWWGISGGEVEVRPPSQSDSRVATRGHFTVSVSSLLGGILRAGCRMRP
jgi:hypothetical protein